MATFSRLKICFLAGTLGMGGAEKQLYLLCKLLRDQGVDVHVMSFTNGEHWQAPIQALGVPIHWVGKRPNKLAKILAIRKVIRYVNPDICQCQHFFTNLFAALACKGTGTKVIGAVRSNIHQEMASRNKWLCLWSLKWPNLIFANSQQAINAAPTYGVSPVRFRYLPNILDLADLPQVKPAKKDRYQIVGLGRMIALKKWDNFLRCLQTLKEQGLAVKGTLVGDGPEREALQQYAKELGLAAQDVAFAGRVKDVRPFLASSDLLLATSSLEGMPNAVMEAMACGLPVVSTSVGAVPDLISHRETGMIAEVDDVAGLSQHCTELLRNYDLRRKIGRQGRAFIQQNHAPKAVLGHLETLYEEVLA